MIQLIGIKKSYGPKLLLKDVSYLFPSTGKIALCGANGAGKTTLLNMMCGLEEPDDGQILKPKEGRIGYLPQEPSETPLGTVLLECQSGDPVLLLLRQRLAKSYECLAKAYDPLLQQQIEQDEIRYAHLGGPSLEGKASLILSGLGFSKSQLSLSPCALSGGLRMRLELAKILVYAPEFLILDEPTNHLDLPSLVFVENYLKNFKGVVLFTSHDRGLLNRLPDTILHLESGVLRAYVGQKKGACFEDFLNAKEQQAEQNQAQKEQLQKQRASLERFVERFSAKASKAAQARSKLKQVLRLKALEDNIDTSADIDSMHLTIPIFESSGREVLKVQDLNIGYAASQPLCEHIQLQILKNQKIAVIGSNGIGKSTLLKTIAGQLQSLSGTYQLGYQVKLALFSQNQLDVLNSEKSVFDNVMHFCPAQVTDKEVRHILGALLFKGNDIFKPLGVLSGGEKSRVGIACLLVQGANFLLLDEPTNHLDMTSVEILTQALTEYEGTVLFVSHDRQFIDDICSHVFVMTKDKRSALFEGKIDDYVRLAKRSSYPNIFETTDENNVFVENTEQTLDINLKQERTKSYLERQKKQRQEEKLQKHIQKLETQLHQITADIHSIESNMALCGTDYQRLHSLVQDKQVKTESLESIEELLLQAYAEQESIRKQDE